MLVILAGVLLTHSGTEAKEPPAPDREARILVEELFRYYLEDPSRLPEGHFSRLSQNEPHWVICNYIAGMTDPYARLAFERAGLSKL